MTEGLLSASAKDDNGVFRRLADDLLQGLLVHSDYAPLYANPAASAILGFDAPSALVEAGSLKPLFPEDVRERLASGRGQHNIRVGRHGGGAALLDLRVTEIE